MNRARAMEPHPCGRAGCDELARLLPSGKYDALCPAHDQEKRRRWHEAHPEQARAKEKARTAREREAVFSYYGQTCACCGSDDRLNIDHLEGGGEAHRRQLGVKGGSPFYRWLINNDFPDGYQTLCFPCNRSKSAGMRCALDHAGKEAA